MRKYKIRISYGRQSHQYQIQLFEHRTWWLFKWWESMLIQRGSRRNIHQYKEQWCKDFSVSLKEVEDSTGDI